jgi:hypothetical protein
MRCDRCGWPVGSVGARGQLPGTIRFFPSGPLQDPQPGFVYVGRKFAKEA